MITELDIRFNKVASQSTSFSEVSVQSYDTLLGFYEDDIPLQSVFDSEFEIWKHKWENQTQLASELKPPGKALPKISFQISMFLLKIVATKFQLAC